MAAPSPRAAGDSADAVWIPGVTITPLEVVRRATTRAPMNSVRLRVITMRNVIADANHTEPLIARRAGPDQYAPQLDPPSTRYRCTALLSANRSVKVPLVAAIV